MTQTFPKTVSAEMGVPTRDRFLEIFRRPLFFVWFLLMLLTSASELSPGQWVDVSLTSVVGMRGVLLLAYVSGIQFVGRHFAGPIAHRLSAEGLLAISSVLAGVGLFGLSLAHSPASALLAATAWGLGICYLWPTMVATVAERYPKGGAWTVGLMGVAGAISNYFVLPVLGRVSDAAAARAAAGQPLDSLSPERLAAVQAYAADESFRAIAVIPAVLVVAFAILWAMRRSLTRGRGMALDAEASST
jgi:fucose permease